MHPDARIARDAFERREDGWVRLMPEVVEDLGENQHHLLDAVEEFESLDNDAGRAATTWLKESALVWHGTTITWLLLKNRRVDAFYASASASVLLSQRDNERLRGRRPPDEVWIPRRQPASLIAWIAKRADSPDAGRMAVMHAFGAAVQVAELQGNMALVLDPYDEETAQMWMRWPHLNFGRSAVERIGSEDPEPRPRRLWTPLRPPD
jgi:hypothetical protein